MTDEFLERLVRDLRPAGKAPVLRRLGIGLLAGSAVSLAGVVELLGLRPDMWLAIHSAMFWVRLAYTLTFAGLGLWCIEKLSRPAGDASRRLPWLLAPFGAIGILAALQMYLAPAPVRERMMMGEPASACPWCILLASLPVFAGLVWAMRGLAPTRLRIAGAVTGLTAGAVAASLYALHSPESTAPFIAIWFTLGILVVGAIGAVLGPRVLRW
jgi:hypothetical protein